MAMTNFLTISDLKYGVRASQINVRVAHKWSRPELSNKNNLANKYNNDDKKKPVDAIEAIELLFVDSKNDCIQATIRKRLMSHFGPKLTVGEVYTIRNLTVDNNTGLDKATPHPLRLKFEFSTRVQPTQDPTIPTSIYRFARFNDILDDVIGKLYEIGPITETPNKHLCRTIKLEDYEGNQLSCTLWGTFTDQVPALISKLPNPEQSKVIVIQCTWRIQTTFNATVFNVNPDIPEVTEFQPTLATPSASNSLQIIEISDDDDKDDMTLESIKSISDIKENEKEGYYYTFAKIVDLDCTFGFQVKFQVSDPSDDLVDFVAFDNQVSQFVTKSASELLSKNEKDGCDPNDIPRDLEVFLDRSFLFKAEMNSFKSRHTPMIQGQSSKECEEDESHAEDNSPKTITPLKRVLPFNDDSQTIDASSTTKKASIVKKEK
ncbi:uncharacterized protein LOC141618526 [Silene latifolia]|uniref:uncharacterized protein LOC141618526 n=1 Tax=Silene latifolia TaxID=37657 RepID=UPI003D789B50